MTDHQDIMAKLDKQDDRLASIEKVVVDIALQKKDIDYLTMQITVLTKRFDNLYSPEGAITKLQDCANACPREELVASVNKLWGALALIIALIGALKIWG